MQISFPHTAALSTRLSCAHFVRPFCSQSIRRRPLESNCSCQCSHSLTHTHTHTNACTNVQTSSQPIGCACGYCLPFRVITSNRRRAAAFARPTLEAALGGVVSKISLNDSDNDETKEAAKATTFGAERICTWRRRLASDDLLARP